MKSGLGALSRHLRVVPSASFSLCYSCLHPCYPCYCSKHSLQESFKLVFKMLTHSQSKRIDSNLSDLKDEKSSGDGLRSNVNVPGATELFI